MAPFEVPPRASPDVRLSVVVPAGVGPAEIRVLASSLEDALAPLRLTFELVGVGSAVDVAGVATEWIGGRLDPDLSTGALLAATAQTCRGRFVWLLQPLLGLWPDGLEALASALAKSEAEVMGFDSRLGVEGVPPLAAPMAARARVGKASPAIGLRDFLSLTGLVNGPSDGSGLILSRSLLIELAGEVGLEDETSLSLRLFLHTPEPRFSYIPAVVTTERLGRCSSGLPGWPLRWARAIQVAEGRAPGLHRRLRKVLDRWPEGDRVRWPVMLASTLLEVLGESDKPYPAADVQAAVTLVSRLLPEALSLHPLLAEMAAMSASLPDPIARIAAASGGYNGREVTTADRLKREAAAWRQAFQAEPWYNDLHIAIWGSYVVYLIGGEWVAARADFTGLPAALEVATPSSMAPFLLVADSEAALRDLVTRQPQVIAPDGGQVWALPGRSARTQPENLAELSIRLDAPPVSAPPVHVHVALPPPPRNELARLQEEVTRQDLEIAALYGSASWRWSAPLRALARRARKPTLSPTPINGPAPILYSDHLIELSAENSAAYLVRGFSTPEDWGRWTDGFTAIIRLRHEVRRGHSLLELWPHHLWRREGPPCTVDLSVNGGDPRPLAVDPGQPLALTLDEAELRATGELDLRFIIRNPKLAAESPLFDRRRLGFGLAAFRLTW